MKKYEDTYDYYVESKDRLGGMIRTDINREGGIYIAISSYLQDIYGEVTGMAQSSNELEAIELSRKDLRKFWREYLEEELVDTGRFRSPIIYIPAKGDEPGYVIKGTLPPGMSVEEYFQTYGCYPLHGRPRMQEPF